MPSPKVFANAAATGPTLQDVAELIKENKAKKIVFLVGAGISTSAGIPDFRSPETGLYANLEQYNLPYPEAIFDLTYFMERPEAFFTLAKEIYPGNYLPTLTHYFFVLLHKKKLLKRVFTQNVDTLERLAGLPDDMLVEAHGSFATARCLKCKQVYDAEELRPRVAKGEILRCQKETCKGKSRALIKSDIVFFGESLPGLFFKRLSDLKDCDLLITIGTSLKVQPFASLVDRVDDETPRVLINLESVGEMDEYEGGGLFGRYREEGFDFNGSTRGGKEFARDVRWLGEADKGVKKLAEALGWADELEELYQSGIAELEKKDLQTKDVPTPKKTQAHKRLSAKEEVQKIVHDIDEVVAKPVPKEDIKETETVEKQDDKKVDDLAKEIQKLDVGKSDSKDEGGREDDQDKKASL